VKIKDIADAAQSLADYCGREGEDADLDIISGQVRLIADRAIVIQLERTKEMVAK